MMFAAELCWLSRYRSPNNLVVRVINIMSSILYCHSLSEKILLSHVIEPELRWWSCCRCQMSWSLTLIIFPTCGWWMSLEMIEARPRVGETGGWIGLGLNDHEKRGRE